MFLRKAVAANALLAANFANLDGLAVDGPFLAAQINGESLQERMAVIDAWDLAVAGQIADADEPIAIAALTDLKRAINELRTDVSRESYIQDSKSAPIETETGEASTDDERSHPTATGDTASSNASQQDGLASEDQENANEQAQPQERKQRRSR